jgi:transposase InsO family protein
MSNSSESCRHWLEEDLPLAALRMALEQRSSTAGLVYHSDRGSQHASTDYSRSLFFAGHASSGGLL